MDTLAAEKLACISSVAPLHAAHGLSSHEHFRSCIGRSALFLPLPLLSYLFPLSRSRDEDLSVIVLSSPFRIANVRSGPLLAV